MGAPRLVKGKQTIPIAAVIIKQNRIDFIKPPVRVTR
jgi:hypothetical protein